MQTKRLKIIGKQFFNERNGKPIMKDVTTKGVVESVPQCIISTPEGQFWVPASIVKEDHNELLVEVVEAGSTFVAPRDSRRTKAQALAAKNGITEEEAAKQLGEEATEKLYYKGETVTREKETYVARVTQTAKLSQREMLEILSKSGANLSSLFTA